MYKNGGRAAAGRLAALAALVLCVLALCAACNGSKKQTDGSAAADRGAAVQRDRRAPAPPDPAGRKTLPIARAYRNYQKVHENVEQAWFLTETAYFVVSDKLQQAEELIAGGNPADVRRGTELKSVNTGKVQTELFAVNPNVRQLFEDAIAAEPDNPLNKVAYAVYLKPRRDYGTSTFTEMYDRALALMDEAIAQWPDEASFYYLKADMMVTTHLVYQYSRSTWAEQELISGTLPQVRDLLAKAEKYDPMNAQVNYRRALLSLRLAPPVPPQDALREALREIKAGNAKPGGYYIYPPPLEPYHSIALLPVLTAESQQAVYYDHWVHYGGATDSFDVEKLVHVFGTSLDWDKDRQDIAAVMFMLYRLGRVKPYTQAWFHQQQQFLDKLREQPDASEQAQLALAGLQFSLDEYYRSASVKLHNEQFSIDPREYNAVGLGKIERKLHRNNRVREIIQPYHAAFLKDAQESLGVEFPLDKDPLRWGD